MYLIKADTNIWNEKLNFLCWPKQSCILRSCRSTIWRCGDWERLVVNFLLQELDSQIFLKYLIVIWLYCVSIPYYIKKCLESVKFCSKFLSKSLFSGKMFCWRPTDTSFIRYSKNFVCMITEENWPAFVYRSLSLEFYYATCTFRCIAWQRLLRQLNMLSCQDMLLERLLLNSSWSQ